MVSLSLTSSPNRLRIAQHSTPLRHYNEAMMTVKHSEAVQMPIAKLITRLGLLAAVACAVLVELAVGVGYTIESNGVIAFATLHDGNGEIYVVDIDSNISQPINLTRSRVEDRIVVWSPDGTTLAFSSVPDAQGWEIYTMSMTGNQITRLTNDEFMDLILDWSGDGEYITIVRHQTAALDRTLAGLYTMDISTGHVKYINNVFVQSSGGVEWSPNGKQIAVISGYDLPPAIYLMQADGSQVHRLINVAAVRGGGLSWSPNGMRIAFIAHTSEGREVYIVDVVDGSIHQLTHSELPINMNPSWSPDGNRIAFISAFGGGSEGGDLYVIDKDGENPRLIATDVVSVAWRPQP